MKTFAERFNEALKTKNISCAEISRITKIDEGTLSNYRKGKYAPKQDKLEKIAHALGVSIPWLMGVEMPDNVIAVTGIIKVYGNIAAGAPILAEENIIDYVPTTLHNPDEYFGLRVEGDSMIGAGIPSGANVILHKQNTAENGQIVACRVNGGEATLKRFRQQNDTVMLLPENSNYVPIIVPVSDFENGSAEILGVLKEINIRI